MTRPLARLSLSCSCLPRTRYSFSITQQQRQHFHCSIIRMSRTLPRLPIFEAISKHDPESTAVVHSDSGRSFTYGSLLQDVSRNKDKLAMTLQGKAADGERIAFLVENSYDYVVTFLAILASNAVAVPLSAGFPAHELRYIINHSQAAAFLTSAKHADKSAEVLSTKLEASPVLATADKIHTGSPGAVISLDDSPQDKASLMLYTSGTTSRPKGVVLPDRVLTAQAKSLLEAWEYSAEDRLLHVLPLHHIHGSINALLTPLFAGSTIEFMFPFNAEAVWKRLAAPFLPKSLPHQKPVTFFTVVPTIYARLLPTFKDLPLETQVAAKTAISPEHMRLNISGSAALPTPTKLAWTKLSSGNILLERYGMTEVGMALSCGLEKTTRVDGSVGWPLPSVEIRLVDTETNEVIQEGDELDGNGRERHGEIQLRGPTVFTEYWQNPNATASEFTTDHDDGNGAWFKTGDIAIRRASGADVHTDAQHWTKGPLYFIQGRRSADIIKSGGEKISALEVEREMLSLPEVEECAVVGVTNEAWGQKVAAVVVLSQPGLTAGKRGGPWSALDMRRALKDRLVAYKVPQEMRVVNAIARNAMGKINKRALVAQLWPES